MNILILTDYFHPSSVVAVQRITSWVRYWTKMGGEIHVISSQKGMSMLPTFDENAVFLHSTSTTHDNTINKSKIEGKIFFSYSCVKFFKYVHRLLKQKVFCNLLEPRIFKLSSLTKQAKRVCEDHRIDVVVSSSPTFVTHLIASRIKKKLPKLIWLADYRDLWSGSPIFPGMPLIARIEREYEKTTLSVADIITTVSNPLAEHLTDLHGKSVHVVPNGIDMDDVVERLDRIKNLALHPNNSSEPAVFLHTGSVLFGLYDLMPLFSSISELIHNRLITEEEIQIVFVGIHNGIDQKAINRLGISNVVELVEPVSRDASLRMQEKADALLFLGAQANGGKAIDGVVSGKVFEYFTSGTEILAIGTTKKMTVGRMIEDSGVGICLGNNVEAIKGELLGVVTRGKRPVSCSQSFIDKYRRDIQAKEMYRLLDVALRKFSTKYPKEL